MDLAERIIKRLEAGELQLNEPTTKAAKAFRLGLRAMTVAAIMVVREEAEKEKVTQQSI